MKVLLLSLKNYWVLYRMITYTWKNCVIETFKSNRILFFSFANVVDYYPFNNCSSIIHEAICSISMAITKNNAKIIKVKPILITWNYWKIQFILHVIILQWYERPNIYIHMCIYYMLNIYAFFSTSYNPRFLIMKKSPHTRIIATRSSWSVHKNLKYTFTKMCVQTIWWKIH